MIVLDTNIISETMRPRQNPDVLAWMASHPANAFYTTTIVEAEILYGIAKLPAGRRRD